VIAGVQLQTFSVIFGVDVFCLCRSTYDNQCTDLFFDGIGIAVMAWLYEGLCAFSGAE
jgi:hypothetical protein